MLMQDLEKEADSPHKREGIVLNSGSESDDEVIPYPYNKIP